MFANMVLFVLLMCVVNNCFVSSRRLGWLFHIEENTESPVCQTEYCKTTANEFLDTMNRSVDPCDDFYEFACGRFEESHEIPSFSPVWSRMDMFQVLVYHRLKRILEIPPQSDDLLPVRQAKKFYRSCIDRDTRERRGIAPLESILMRAGGWPLVMELEEWDADEYTWQNVEHYYFHTTGSFVFYQFDVFRSNIMGVEPGDFPLKFRFIFSERNYTGSYYYDYVDTILSVAQIFIAHSKSHVSEEMLHKDITDLIDFEQQLYEITGTEGNWDGETLDNFTEWYDSNISEMNNRNDKIEFKKLLKMMFDLINVKVENTMKVYIKNPMYFVKLTELLNQTPSRTIVNYIHWHFISDMIIYTTEEMSAIFDHLVSEEFGVLERAPRWLSCLQQTEMVEASAYAFMKHYFTEETENNMVKMIDDVRDSMSTLLDLSDLMFDNERDHLKEKLNNMTFLYGFPDWYKNTTAIVNSFRGLTIGYDFMDNILSYQRYRLKTKLRQSVLDDEQRKIQFRWTMNAITVNAMFDGESTIEIPAADFQPPLFTTQFPQSVNYGMTGVVVGHEIGHGFDGRDETPFGGNIKGISKDTVEKFQNHVKCYEDQMYDIMNNPERHNLTREMMLAQTISDAIGLQSGFIAYHNVLDRNGGIDSKLPGLEEFTHDQMFFISFAGVWCDSMTEKYAAKLREYGIDDEGRQRVLSATSNNDDFAEAFNCPKGSAMNRMDKCNIWDIT